MKQSLNFSWSFIKGFKRLIYLNGKYLENHPKSKLTIKKDLGHYFHTNKDKGFIKNWTLSSL